jgi:hypothetical protein
MLTWSKYICLVGLLCPSRAKAVISVLGTSEKLLKQVSSTSSIVVKSAASVPNEMTRWLLRLSYEDCVVTDTDSDELCVDVRDNAGLTGEAVLEYDDLVV